MLRTEFSNRLFHTEDGREHLITESAASRITAEFGNNWPRLEESEARLKNLVAIAEDWYNGVEYVDLPDNIGESIRVCDLIRNMNARSVALRGRRMEHIFNEPCPLDLVKLNTWHPDTCECIVIFIWRQDHDEDMRVHYPHVSKKRCRYHAHLTNAADHYHAVMAENQGKNRMIGAIVEETGVPWRDISWEFDANRKLRITGIGAMAA